MTRDDMLELADDLASIYRIAYSAPAICRAADLIRELAEAARIESEPGSAQQPVAEAWRKVVNDLLFHIGRNTCEHHETHRGGAIWEICDACGAKWADDEGGKPEFRWPEVVERARAMLYAAPVAPQPPAQAEPIRFSISPDGAVKTTAADVLATPQAKAQLAAVAKMREQAERKPQAEAIFTLRDPVQQVRVALHRPLTGADE